MCSVSVSVSVDDGVPPEHAAWSRTDSVHLTAKRGEVVMQQLVCQFNHKISDVARDGADGLGFDPQA